MTGIELLLDEIYINLTFDQAYIGTLGHVR